MRAAGRLLWAVAEFVRADLHFQLIQPLGQPIFQFADVIRNLIRIDATYQSQLPLNGLRPSLQFANFRVVPIHHEPAPVGNGICTVM